METEQPVPTLGPWPASPYPGLRSFVITPEGDESRVFFGRRRQVFEILDQLFETQFVAVVGASGCGKSSLVRVGVIPELLAGRIQRAGSQWVTVAMEPGGDPFFHLSAGIQKTLGAMGGSGVELPELPLDLLQRPGPEPRRWDGLARFGQYLSKTPGGPNLLLLVDQFEELFRDDLTAPDAAADFINFLLNVYYDRPERLFIVLTMRTDFLEQCGHFRGLPEVMNRTQYLVPGLNGEEVRQAIVQPAALDHYKGEVEPELVEQLIRDFEEGPTYDPDRLPLLQQILARLWEDATPGAGGRRALTLARCRELGGLKGGLARHAQWIFDDECNNREKCIAEAAMRLLVQAGPGDKPVRRAAEMEEIKELADALIRLRLRTNPDPVVEPEIRDVVEKFQRPGRSFVRWKAGLVEGGPARLDVTHEAFIRQWPALGSGWATSERRIERESRWVQEQAESHRGRNGRPVLRQWEWQRVEQAWSDHPPAPIWARKRGLDAAEIGRFVDASRRDIRRRATRRRWAWAGAAALLAIALSLSVGFSKQAERRGIARVMSVLGEQSRTSTFAQQQAALAAQSLSIALETGQTLTPDAEAQARRVLREAALFSLGSSYQPGTYLWKFDPPLRGGSIGRASGTGTPVGETQWRDPQPTDARLLVGASTLAHLPMESCHHAAMPEELDLLGVGGRNGHVDLYNLRTAQPPEQPLARKSLPANSDVATRVTGLAFGPACDFLTVATAGGRVFLLRIAAGQLSDPVQLEGHHEGPVNHFRLLAEGRYAVSAGEDGQVLMWDLWNLESVGRPRRLIGAQRGISAFDAAADGSWIAAAGRGQESAVLWRPLVAAPGSDVPGASVASLGGTVSALALAPDRRTLVTGSHDGVVAAWRLDSTSGEAGLSQEILSGDTDIIYLVVSPDSRWLAASGGSDDSALRVWNIAGGSIGPPVVEQGLDGLVSAVAFSPDSQRLVAGNWQGLVTYRLNPAGTSFEFDGELTIRGSWPSSVYFESGRRLAVGGLNGVTLIEDVDTGRNRFIPGHDTYVTSLAVSQDRRWLVSGSQDGQVAITPFDEAPEIDPMIFRAAERSAALDASGAWLASRDNNRRPYLWQVSGMVPVRVELPVEGVDAVQFTPDGRRLLATTRGSLLAWDLATVSKWPEDPAAIPKPVSLPMAADTRVIKLGVSNDGKFLGAEFNRVGGGLWRWTDSEGAPRLERLRGRGEDGMWAAFDPRSRFAIAQSDTQLDWVPLPAEGVTLAGTRKLLDLARRKETTVPVAVSADGALLGAADGRNLHLWRTADVSAQTETITANADVGALAFSPDGRWLVYGDLEGRVFLHEVGKGTTGAVRELRSHGGDVGAIRFSADGKTLATTGGGNDIFLYRFTPPNLDQPIILDGLGSSVNTLEFTPANRLLTVSVFQVRLYDLDLQRLLGKLCRVAGRNLTAREREIYLPGVEYKPGCPAFP
jgi:WD40 repeat protein